ncbi:PriCT-2 domain-containing protein [Tianweitania sediminis]|uniref:PriCT-2 domain-containing protein n=1 Tax=Tianweitania sediminis TaxID=1502156 RepID=A0A8J7UL82_9HYPH|nr:PriCT-2 domain-containing protein [Tianweitania sediminis]MBP0440670.1 PriCT-2 domain-containing protein [Tianweitania sediminis]
MSDTMTLNDVQQLRRTLLDRGYKPVPVFSIDYHFCNSPGKQPEGKAWNEMAKAGHLPALSTKAMNTGILCDGLRVVDVDVDDPDAAREITHLARDFLGTAPERYRGNSARRTIVYRAAEGEPRKRSVTSATIRNQDGKPAKVEVLGQGQQFVAYGFHPSGAELLWSEPSLGEVVVQDLPTVSEAEITDFLEAAGRVIGASHEQGQDLHHAAASSSPITYTLQGAEEEEIAELLTYVDPDLPYDEWVQILAAIHDATGGSGSGLAMADEWSSRGRKYKNNREMAQKWKSFGKRSGITSATIADYARRGGADLSDIAIRHRGMPAPSWYDPVEAKKIADAILKSAMNKIAAASAAEDDVHNEEDDEDLGGAHDHFDLPETLMRPGGVVQDLTDWICEWTGEPVRIHALGAALVIVGALVGRKVYTQKRPTCTALYIGAVAPSGMGKQHPQNAIKLVLDEIMGSGRGHTGWNVSLPAIAMALMDNASKVMVADEFADKLVGIRHKNASTSQSAISEGLRSLWGTNIGSYTPDVSITRGDVKIHRPNMSFYGSATIRDFTRSLVSKDVTSGLLNRFLILPRFDQVEHGADPEGIMTLPASLRQRLQWLYNCLPDPLQATMAVRGDGFPHNPVMVPMNAEAAAMDEENKAEQKRFMRGADDDPTLSLYGRYAEQIKRVALITACGRNPEDLSRAVLDASAMKFARELVTYSLSQFVLMVRRDMVENQVEANRAAVLNLIRARKEITRSELLRRIRHISARDLKDAIQLLQEAHCIIEARAPTRTNSALVYRYLRG